VDTDQLFKELLRVFFREFLELFFPEIASRLDFGQVRFLDKEVFTDFPEGRVRRADTVVEVHTRDGAPELVLFHVEVQGTRPPEVPYRMWEYFSLLRMRFRVPVFPAVIYVTPGAGGLTEETYAESVFDRQVLSFRYAVVGLPDLSADDYRESENPLAPALSTAMRAADQERWRRKYDALLQTSRSGLDDARKELLASVIEAFLPLRASAEQAEFQRLVARDEAQEVRQMISVYKREGMLLGQKEMLLRLMRRKFGELPKAVVERVEAIETQEELEALSDRILTAATLDEMGLTAPPPPSRN
jgi:Putative transposase, YhgA-like.